MSPERWQKVNEVFQEAVELEPEEQKTYLEKVCADDDSLLQQVQTLLAANEQAGTFIAGNAAKDVAHLLTLENSPTLTGESLGHYEIISILGSGGMGKVYLAKDSKLNRSIAVKTLPHSISNDSDHVKRFQTEAKAAANLNHPNVATVYSVEETDDKQTFITMEYVEGQPLGKMIPKGGLDQRTFLEWFVSIADALSHAHEKGIVHRDIKPSNIMITPTGTPKILDFGLARIDKSKITEEDSTLSLTKTGQVLGTPAYMSPEQAEGKDADHRTDIFSLGVVMYEAITGERPFKGDNYASIISNLLGKEPKNITEIKPEVPYLLSRIIMKCLSKEARFRYQTMSEVRILLKEVNAALDSNASLSRPNQLSLSKNKGISPIYLYSLIGLLSLLLLFAGWSWFSQGKEVEDSIVKVTLVSEKATSLEFLNARLSPDGKNLLLAKFENKEKKLYLRPLNSFNSILISGVKDFRTAFFSNDGKWVAFTTISEQMKKVPIEGGNPITICESCQLKRPGYWADDGYIYFSSKNIIQRVSADGGTPEELTKLDAKDGQTDHLQPQLLPDGKTLLFTVSRNDETTLGLLSLEDKSWKQIEETGDAWFPVYLSTGHIVFIRDTQMMAIPFDLASLKVTGKAKLVESSIFKLSPNNQISNNGTLIYLPTISRTDNQIVTVDKKGKVTPLLEKKGDYNSPKVSPDGTRVAVTFENDIWVYNIKDESGIRITDNGKSQIPAWSTDGQFVFYSTEKAPGEYFVYRKSADGTGAEEEIHSGTSRVAPYSMHPTDDVLAIASRENSSDVILKSLTENKIQSSISTKYVEDTPRFSADGKWLAYFSMDTGMPRIYVHPWSDLSKKIPVTKDPGMFPVWSPNNKELFFRLGNKFYSVDINTSQGFEATDRKFLFEGKYLTGFDVMPDGEKFVMVKDEHGTLPSKLNIVLNWTQELEQIMKESE